MQKRFHSLVLKKKKKCIAVPSDVLILMNWLKSGQHVQSVKNEANRGLGCAVELFKNSLN